VQHPALILALLTGVAWAHGPAPAALAPLHAEGGEARAVLTSIGIATRWGDEFRYLGPSLWSANGEIPAAAALDDGTLVVAASGGLFRAGPDGCSLEALTPAGWDRQLVFGATASGARAVVLTRGLDGGSTAWTVGVVGPAAATTWDDLAADSALLDARGGLWVAAARPAPTLVTPTGRVAIDAPAPDFLDLRLVDGPAAYVAASRGATTELWRVGAEGRVDVQATADGPLHGPVPSAGGLLLLVDGELRRGDGEAWTAIGPRPWTCLAARGDAVVACADRDLVRLDDALHATPWFALASIAGVDPACPADASAREACQRDWIHFGAEAGLLRAPDAGPPPDAGVADAGTTASAGGCAGSPGPLLPLLMGLLGRRRNRA
jgi:hypothetical protein